MSRRKTRKSPVNQPISEKSTLQSLASDVVEQAENITQSEVNVDILTTELNVNILKPTDFIELMVQSSPEIVSKLTRTEQLTFIRSLFDTLAAKVEHQENGKLVIKALGVFNVKNIEKVNEEGGMELSKRIVFRPRRIS